IASEPQARWINSPQDLDTLPELLQAARAQGALPVLVAYWIPDRGCSHHKQGAPSAAAYRDWIGSMIRRLGSTRAVVVLEPDALPADCFDAGRARLMAETVRRLEAAGQSVYIDAGHAAWKSTGDTAERLLAAGIADAEGFAVNVSNRQTTAASVAWGRELSDLVGHRPFVVHESRPAGRRRAAVDQAAGGVGWQVRRGDVVLLLGPAGAAADPEQSAGDPGRPPAGRGGD